MQALAEIVYRLSGKGRAGTRARRECRSGICGGQAGRGLAGHFRLGTRHQCRHTVDEACCRRGGVAGAEPPHKGGPNRPDRTTAVVSGQWLVVRGGVLAASDLMAEWPWFGLGQRYVRVHYHYWDAPKVHCRCWLGSVVSRTLSLVEGSRDGGIPSSGDSRMHVQEIYRKIPDQIR